MRPPVRALGHRCDGTSGTAAAAKRVVVPPGVGALRLKVKIAAFAGGAPGNVDLEVRFERADGTVRPDERWVRSPKITPGSCAKFTDGGGSKIRCSGWRTASMLVTNPPSGNSRVVFQARHDNTAVALLLDRFVASIETP
jgi:hypothetical protein